MFGCSKDCLSLIPFSLPQINCFTLSLKCFSSDTDNCPAVGIGPLLQFPHPLRLGPVLLILLLFLLVPSSYRVFHGSIYSFPLVRSSCLLSSGVCMHFCIWRYVSDVSLESDVLHIHLLRHLVLQMLSFKPALSLSFFIFIKRLFSSSLSAMRVVSFAYLRLLIFLHAILIPAYISSSPAFLVIYSAYKLNKQVTVYSLDILLSWFVTSLLFHVQF